MTRHAWTGWYFVPHVDLRMALPAAKRKAHADHPDTPIASMMTPEIHRYRSGVKVFVTGRSDVR